MNDQVDAIFEQTSVPEAPPVGGPQAPPAGGSEAAGEPEAIEPIETVEGVPVLAEARPLAVAPAPLPSVQAAAVAATGFVAGAATLALVRRHSARKAVRRSATRRAADMLPIVGSRTFIVDVHLLAKPSE